MPDRTDAERERAIRERVTILEARHFTRAEVCFLLFLLDEARAERDDAQD